MVSTTLPAAAPSLFDELEDNGPTPFVEGKAWSVYVPRPLANFYDYLASPDQSVVVGQYVKIEFGRKTLTAVVWKEADSLPEKGKTPENSKNKEKRKIKPLEIIPIPPMSDKHRQFLEFVADYTMAPQGAVVKMAITGINPPLKILWKTSRKQEVAPIITAPAVSLSPAQQQIVQEIEEYIRHKQGFSASLLEGVTGSGKTEIYAQIGRQITDQGAQILILLPEIALTAQLAQRLAERFGVQPVLWHSGLTEAQRRKHWLAINNGTARLVVGARSAVMLPFADLQMIVVDEEHEQAFKQEDGVMYHGRDMAVARAHLLAIPILLCSATPSLETRHNVQQGKYKHFLLASRYNQQELPQITLIDLKEHALPSGQFLAAPLRAALQENLAIGQQSLLFLNRRGYAPLTLCRNCGHRWQCPQCTAWLVMHQHRKRLQCHHCGYQCQPPQQCPECASEGCVIACGPGVERVAEEVLNLFPHVRMAVISSDDGFYHHQGHQEPITMAGLIEKMEAAAIDIVVGTQILAKGLHFPDLTLVAVVDADLGVEGADLRAAERMYQLLVQVSGRAGRGEKVGKALLQTWTPSHPVLQSLRKGDHHYFINYEINSRKRAGMPPFGRLAALIIADAEEKRLEAVTRELSLHIPSHAHIRVLGPAPAPMALLRGQHRRRFLIKAPLGTRLQYFINDWLKAVSIPSQTRLQIDIDPYSFM